MPGQQQMAMMQGTGYADSQQNSAATEIRQPFSPAVAPDDQIKSKEPSLKFPEIKREASYQLR